MRKRPLLLAAAEAGESCSGGERAAPRFTWRSGKGKAAHLELLLDDFHVVPLQEVLLVAANPVQLREQTGEELSCQGFVVGSRVPDRTHTGTHTSESTAKNNTLTTNQFPFIAANYS